MAKNTLAAKRYANALYSVVKGDEGAAELKDSLSELKLFYAAVEKADGGEEFFFSPVVSADDKISVLNELMKVFTHTHSFLLTLVKEGRLNCLKEIIDEFASLCEKASGELSVNLEMAQPLPEKQLDEIKLILQEKWKTKVKMKTTVNPELIGGFVATAPGRVMDASLSNQLDNLEQFVLS
jgi:F-type H+-transporting ATPase subunit delta